MSYIDSAILNFTERCCRKFQELTGRTNVWLAFQLTNLSIVLYFVGAGIYFWLSGGAARVAIAVFCGALLYLLLRTVFAVPVETSESAAYQRVARGLRNPRRVRDAPLRIVFLTMALLLCYPIALVYTSLGLVLPLLSYSLIILTTAVLYLLACDPLPPCPDRVREWIEALAIRLARAPNSLASEGANRSNRTSHARIRGFACWQPVRISATALRRYESAPVIPYFLGSKHRNDW